MSDKKEEADPGLVNLTARGSCVECKATYERQVDVTARFQGAQFFVPEAWAQVVITINEPILPPSVEAFVHATVGAMPQDLAENYLAMIRDTSPSFQSVALLCPSCLETGKTPNLWAWFKRDFDAAVHRHVEEVSRGNVFEFPMVGRGDVPDFGPSLAPEGYQHASPSERNASSSEDDSDA